MGAAWREDGSPRSVRWPYELRGIPSSARLMRGTVFANAACSAYAGAASSSVEVAVGLEASTNPLPAGLPGAVWRRTLP